MNFSFYSFGLTALLFTALHLPGQTAKMKVNAQNSINSQNLANAQSSDLELSNITAISSSTEISNPTTARPAIAAPLSTEDAPRSPAQPTFPQQPPVSFEGSTCTQLNEAASEVETAMISLYFALDLRSELIEEQFQRTQTNLDRLRNLKLSDAHVRHLQGQYTNKVTPLLPAIASKVRQGLTLRQRRALAASFKVEVDEINQFRQNSILLEDCQTR
jgi:hypothetical protein